MRIGVKVLSPSIPAKVDGVACTRQRVYLAEIDISKPKEALDEVMRGRQAVGNDNRTMLRCGDGDFYGVEHKLDILNWVADRLKKEGKK